MFRLTQKDGVQFSMKMKVCLYATVHDRNEVLGQSTLCRNSCMPEWLFNEKFYPGSKPVGRIRIVALFVVLVVDPGDGMGDNLLVVRHGCCVGLGQKQWSRLVIFYYWHQGFNISKEWKNTTSFCNVCDTLEKPLWELNSRTILFRDILIPT